MSMLTWQRLHARSYVAAIRMKKQLISKYFFSPPLGTLQRWFHASPPNYLTHFVVCNCPPDRHLKCCHFHCVPSKTIMNYWEINHLVIWKPVGRKWEINGSLSWQSPTFCCSAHPAWLPPSVNRFDLIICSQSTRVITTMVDRVLCHLNVNIM